MMSYIKNRLREASTWRGFTMLLTAFGIALTPEQAAAIASVGMAVAGALGVFTRD